MEENFQQQENYSQPINNQVTPKRSNKKIILISLIIVCILTMLTVTIYFLLVNNKNIQNSTQSNQNLSGVLVKSLLEKSIIPADIAVNGQQAVVKLDNYPGNVFLGEKQLHFSPDFKHVAYIAENGTNTDVYLDGVLVPIEDNNGYPYKVNYDFSFSPDNNHFVFTVIRTTGKDTNLNPLGEPNNLEYAIYYDGIPSRIYKYVTDFTFSPKGDRYAYRASDNSGNFLVIDGKEQPRYNWVDGEMVFFSPDGQRVAYRVETNDGHSYFVIDGVKENYLVNQWSTNFAFSPDSKHYAYISNSQIIFDGKTSDTLVGEDLTVSGLQIAPNDKTLSYWVTRNVPGQYLIINGKEFGPYESVIGASSDVVYSSDGSHYAFSALPRIENPIYGVPIKNSIIVVKDGKTIGTYDGVVGLAFDNKDKLVYSYNICSSSDGSFSTYSNFASSGQVICVFQKGGTAKPPFTNTLKWGDKIIAEELNSVITGVSLNPSGKNLVYLIEDKLGTKKYQIVSNGVKSDYYDKLYGPIFTDNGQVLFWIDQKGQISLIALDNSGEINNQKQQQVVSSGSINKISGWKTYTNNQYGFEFRYPSDLDFSLVSTQYNFVSLSGGVETDIPKAYNISDSFQWNQKIYVGVTSAATKELCVPGVSVFPGVPTQISVGNIIFNKYKIGRDCAMDGCSIGDVYTTWHNNMCYELSWFAIQASASKSYGLDDPRTIVVEKNAVATSQKITETTEKILSFFKFTK